jgi:hypothetical protein
MALVWVWCPPGPGGQLPSRHIEPINVWRLVEDTLNVTCNFLYCNHQVHRDFLSPCINEPNSPSIPAGSPKYRRYRQHLTLRHQILYHPVPVIVACYLLLEFQSKWNNMWEVEAQLHLFITSQLYECESLSSGFGRLYPDAHWRGVQVDASRFVMQQSRW